MVEGWVFLPFHQRVIERAAELFLPDQSGRVGAHHSGRYIPSQQSVHRGTGQSGAARSGNAHDIRVLCYSVTAKMVKISSTTEIALLYWKKGDRSLDRSFTRTRLFSMINRTIAMPQPMK